MRLQDKLKNLCPIAQLVERRTVNSDVPGSRPGGAALSLKINRIALPFSYERFSPMKFSFVSFKSSWRNQLWPLRIARAWLGFTWIYAGWDKASDPGFLTAGSTTYLGTQLSSYVDISPIGFLIEPVLSQATYVGIAVMVAEFAIGIATLAWIAPTLAAAGGFFMSVTLFLTSSWAVDPYFLAGDSAYAILWLVYFLFLYQSNRRRKVTIDRRGFLRLSSVTALAFGAIALGNLLTRNSSKIGVNQSPSQILKDADLKVGDTFSFTAKDNGPGILFKTRNGVFAYSAVCTHQGCTAQHNPDSGNIFCACHGAEFDPLDGAKAIAGPTSKPLPKIKVEVAGDWIVEL